MRRVRLALLMTVVGLALPVVLLVGRALESVAFENRARHEAVASRVFDEMERALSRFLEREEARPFEHYHFYLPGKGDTEGIRSPLSYPPGDEFVVGYFQIDPDGRLYSPLRPRDPERARRAGDWAPSPELEQRVASLEQLLTPYRDQVGEKREASRAGRRTATPGDDLARSASELLRAPRLADSRDLEEDAPSEEGPNEGQERPTTSPYEVLESLNRAVQLRSERKQKIVEAPRSSVFTQPQSAPEPREPQPRQPESELEPESTAGRTPEMESGLVGPNEPGRARLSESAIGEAHLEKRDRRTVRLAVDPMVGRALEGNANHLLLTRTVLVGEQGYRQGLVLDRLALGRWLEREIPLPRALARSARLVFLEPGQEASKASRAGEGEFVFTHRFGEPFDHLRAAMALAPLPGVDTTTTIYALSALLAVVAAAGLLAIHRMVSVAVHFAERRNNFVSAVSHELKTPLTAIRMYGEMLRDGLVTSDQKRGEYYRTISDESERLSRLIDNVLEFSKLEKGEGELALVAGSVGSVLEEVAETLRPHAENEGFRLRVQIEEGLPEVRFHRDALLQVLFNLVDNSMKYAKGAARSEVLLEARREDDGVVVSVRDFGPGVARKHLRRIFEPFYRGGNELTRSSKGTGIGLALVRDLADRMGAAVSVDNAEGGGFRVTIAFRSARA